MVPKTFLYLLCFVLVQRTVHGTDEIITLQTNYRIYCVTTDNETPIFVTPPIIEVPREQLSLLKNGKWINDDWLITNASDSLQAPVTDKRWEDFEIINSKFVGATSATSFSFSIYSLPEIHFLFLNDENLVHRFVLNRTSVEEYDKKWTHLTIFQNNRNLFIYENEERIYERRDFNANEFIMRTEKNSFWKIHDYQFKWAKTVQKQDPTTLAIPPAGKSCVMLYVALCEKCLLNVGIISGNRSSIEEIRSFDTSETSMISWQTHQIAIEPDMETSFTFHRRKISESLDETGYWGIDIRECPLVKQNKVIYSTNFTTLSREDRTCTFLTKQNELKRSKSNVEQNATFHCEPGMLGSKCDISCEDILGSGSPHCGKYKICQNLHCFCAWGYHGEFCQERCEMGRWSISCKNVCDWQCLTCDRITGECTIKVIWTFLSILSLLVLTIKMMVYIVMKIRKSRKHVGATYTREEAPLKSVTTKVHLQNVARSIADRSVSLRKCTGSSGKKL